MLKKYLLGTMIATSVLITPVMLQGCVAPALLLSPQSQLMWALLKPMVGLDPKEVQLFKQELVRSRLQPLLGQHYQTAVTLLETADQIQQEGPLFYVASRYTPLPDVAEKAGFVWNSETNQMAVLLVSGGAPQIFAEKLNQQVAQQVPAWPTELAEYTDPDKLKQKALQQARAQADTILPTEVKQLKSEVEQVKAQAEALQKLPDTIGTEAKQQTQAALQQAEAAQQLTQQVNQQKQEVKQQVNLQKQQAAQQIASANAADDFAAEMLAEQQENALAEQRQQLTQQLAEIDHTLSQSKEPAKITELQQKRRQLAAQLQALTEQQ